MLPQWVIERKRDGNPLTEEEIRFFINGYADGDIPDYQMASLAMAVLLRGMSDAEVAALTDAMLKTGRILDTASLPFPRIDKHSTGGIGDKVSLILAPLVACCGIGVPMISGRGLGVTGGTLDKLEAIPGYRTNLSIEEFLSVLRSCGCSIIGQTADLAPVDRKLYALRDVTGTVPSIPLISASILSKKLAEGIDGLVLDVKWGAGAFMKTLEDARTLARTMMAIGHQMGKGVTALLTDMNQPLGRSVGNAVEVAECIETLQGNGPADLVELTLELGAHMLLLGRRESNRDQALDRLRQAIESGAALERFGTMIRLHGADPAILDDLSRLPGASLTQPFPSPGDGYVEGVDAGEIGRACLVLGAGRRKVDDGVDPAVGVTGLVKVGEAVTKDQPLLFIHANDRGRLQEAADMIARAFSVAREQPRPSPLISDVLTGSEDVE